MKEELLKLLQEIQVISEFGIAVPPFGKYVNTKEVMSRVEEMRQIVYRMDASGPARTEKTKETVPLR